MPVVPRTRPGPRRAVAGAVVLLGLTASCSDDDDAGDPPPASTTAPTTTAPATAAYVDDLAALAADEMDGRDNNTPGSAVAQQYLIGRLEEFAAPLGEDFRQPFADGTNVLAVVEGTELPDEYVVLGAHYDHLGNDCRSTDPADEICNGATDNAAGVATVLDIGRRLAADGTRRSVVLAFWDAEEDGLLGSAAYVADPGVPLDDTIAYLNWDNQGSNLLPSLRNLTVMVGAETGGPELLEAAAGAAEASELVPVGLSLLFGQGRSDHAVFAQAGIPTVFSTDATAGCYHTAQDDLGAVDVDKLGREIDMGEDLARTLADTTTPPTFVAGTPPATFADAQSMLEIVSQAQPDLGLFPAEAQASSEQYLADLQSIVDAGEAAFDEEATGTLLSGAVDVVLALAETTCDAYVD